jgi:NAD(P)-dependent dehydrogenase (short-subunit alcohol dehydrogenase family)
VIGHGCVEGLHEVRTIVLRIAAREDVMTKQMQDKVCVITGGAGSIGAASAKLLVGEGAKVVLVDLQEAALKKTTAVARFGKIDLLFSNAGNFGVVAPIADYPEDIFDSVIAVHVKGAFLFAKHALPQMNDGGSIVITSSVAGVRGDPGVCAYITAKHAQIGLMRVLAKEAAARNIRVNTLHPGPVDNDFQLNVERRLGAAIGRDGTQFFNEIIPLHRHVRADEVARSVLFLASAASSFTTGSLLMVDGGLSA